jgi:hypothetical protein
MKPKIAPEVDQLMWLVAEEATPAAMEDFVARFPDLRSELMKRVEMVRSLRGAGGGKQAVREALPHFQPRITTKVDTTSRLGSVAAIITAVAIICLGTLYLAFRPREVRVIPDPKPISIDLPTASPSTMPTVTPTPSPTTMPTPGPSPSPSETPGLPAYLTPTRFAFMNSKLAAAIRTVCVAGELKVTIEPGLPDIEITREWPEATPIDVLKEMGTDYGFDAFETAPGQIQIVPKKDKPDPTPTVMPNNP